MTLFPARVALRRSARRRFAVAVAVLALAGAVAAHHQIPELHGMVAGAACVAVLAVGVSAVARVFAYPRLLLRPGDMPLIRMAPARTPRAVPARGSPLYVALRVLRR